jgi:peptidoglycan/xylan/chitin deacetylase (PgdA/CDA1 family)
MMRSFESSSNPIVSRAMNRLTRAWPAKAMQCQLTRPIATISFDDFPQSAWTQGGPILERAGVRATYFVSGSFCGREVDGIQYFGLEDLRAAYEAGHEIGCHTFDHCMASQVSPEVFTESLSKNTDFVRDKLGDVIMTSFAFPYGSATISSKYLVSKKFAASRGIWPGLNVGAVDLSQLRAMGIEAHVLEKYPIKTMIKQAIAKNGWLIFFTHDVADTPSPWGCTPDQLKQLISMLSEAGIEILPMNNAIGRMFFS